eukprot:3166491-Prymnesium_polylepis.1
MHLSHQTERSPRSCSVQARPAREMPNGRTGSRSSVAWCGAVVASCGPQSLIPPLTAAQRLGEHEALRVLISGTIIHTAREPVEVLLEFGHYASQRGGTAC